MDNFHLENQKPLRCLNLANNFINKLVPLMERSLQVVNLANNRLKSLSGLESWGNIRFLNLSGNQLTSLKGLNMLQSLKEVILSYNHLSIIREVGEIKSLLLVDLSFNKLVDCEKLEPLINLRHLQVASFNGNQITGDRQYQTALRKYLKGVREIDPPEIHIFSTFRKYEAFCFTDEPPRRETPEKPTTPRKQQVRDKSPRASFLDTKLSNGSGRSNNTRNVMAQAYKTTVVQQPPAY